MTDRGRWGIVLVGVGLTCLLALIGGVVGYEAAMPDVRDSSNASPPPEGLGAFYGAILGASLGFGILVVRQSVASATIALALSAIVGGVVWASWEDAESAMYVLPFVTVVAWILGLAAAMLVLGVAAVGRRMWKPRR